MVYSEYLKTPHWINLRNLKLNHSNFQCEICGKKEFLNVHHLFYRNLYDCKLMDLQTLCRDCHKEVHGINKGIEEIQKRKESNRIISIINNQPPKKDIKNPLFLDKEPYTLNLKNEKKLLLRILCEKGNFFRFLDIEEFVKIDFNCRKMQNFIKRYFIMAIDRKDKIFKVNIVKNSISNCFEHKKLKLAIIVSFRILLEKMTKNLKNS